MVVTRSQSAWATPAGWSTYTHIRSRPVSSTASTSTPGRVDSTRWAISRSSCFSFACVSAIELSSKKTGAARPFLRSGEMWCEKDSKRLRAGELREAEQGDAEDDKCCAGKPCGTDPLAEDRRRQDDGDDDARLSHRRHPVRFPAQTAHQDDSGGHERDAGGLGGGHGGAEERRPCREDEHRRDPARDRIDEAEVGTAVGGGEESEIDELEERGGDDE